MSEPEHDLKPAVVIEHERTLSAELRSLSEGERAFRRWMEDEALAAEPEAAALEDEGAEDER